METAVISLCAVKRMWFCTKVGLAIPILRCARSHRPVNYLSVVGFKVIFFCILDSILGNTVISVIVLFIFEVF